MRIIGIAQVRNESDILELFCRYHFQLLDGMIVTDHMSVDPTPDILRSLREEGFPLDIRESRDPALKQNVNSTDMMRSAVKDHGADWVVPLDADEFLTSVAGSPVREVLGAIAADKPVLAPWKNYIPTSGTSDNGENILEMIDHRLKEEYKQFYKTLAPASLVRKGATMSQGNHWLLRPGRDKAIKSFETSTTLALAHFPVRSSNQIANKAFAGWLAALSDPHRREDQSTHWRKLYHRFACGVDLSEEELRDTALEYLAGDEDRNKSLELVRDPVKPPVGPITLAYSSGASLMPLAVLAAAAENLADEYRLLRMKGAREGSSEKDPAGRPTFLRKLLKKA